MEAHARQRLSEFGKLCCLLGAATQVMGSSLLEFDPEASAKAGQEIRDLLMRSADVCDALAQYSVDTAHLDPGYDGDDATSMAILFRILDRLGSVVAQISEFSLFDPAGAKFETWIEVGAQLRDAAIAAGHRGDFLDALARDQGRAAEAAPTRHSTTAGC